MNAPLKPHSMPLRAGHVTLWDTAKRLGDWTYASLADAAGMTYFQVTRHVRGWEQAGAVSAVSLDPDRRTRFAVINPEAIDVAQDARPAIPARPRQTPAGNMWTAMRGLGSFTPVDLAAHASTEEVQVTLDAARAYARALARGGYLRIVRKAIPGKREAIYRLVRNTGPLAPRERRVTLLYDANQDAFVGGPEGGK